MNSKLLIILCAAGLLIGCNGGGGSSRDHHESDRLEVTHFGFSGTDGEYVDTFHEDYAPSISPGENGGFFAIDFAVATDAPYTMGLTLSYDRQLNVNHDVDLVSTECNYFDSSCSWEGFFECRREFDGASCDGAPPVGSYVTLDEFFHNHGRPAHAYLILWACGEGYTTYGDAISVCDYESLPVVFR